MDDPFFVRNAQFSGAKAGHHRLMVLVQNVILVVSPGRSEETGGSCHSMPVIQFSSHNSSLSNLIHVLFWRKGPSTGTTRMSRHPRPRPWSWQQSFSNLSCLGFRWCWERTYLQTSHDISTPWCIAWCIVCHCIRIGSSVQIDVLLCLCRGKAAEAEETRHWKPWLRPCPKTRRVQLDSPKACKALARYPQQRPLVSVVAGRSLPLVQVAAAVFFNAVLLLFGGCKATAATAHEHRLLSPHDAIRWGQQASASSCFNLLGLESWPEEIRNLDEDESTLGENLKVMQVVTGSPFLWTSQLACHDQLDLRARICSG